MSVHTAYMNIYFYNGSPKYEVFKEKADALKNKLSEEELTVCIRWVQSKEQDKYKK